jgi:hypothetical protein
MSARKRGRKPPRVVLLDTRSMADLDGLSTHLSESIGYLDALLPIVRELSEGIRQIIPIISEMHQAQQKRSDAARRANQTRRERYQPPAGATPAQVGEEIERILANEGGEG